MKKIITIGILMFLAVCCSAQNIRHDSLMLHLPFNGNANDVSGNNYHGMVQGAAITTGSANQPLGAYFFDGINSAISIPNIKKLSGPLEAFTILIRLQPQLPPDPLILPPKSPYYTFLTWHRKSADSTDDFLHSRIHTGWQPANGGTEPEKTFLSYNMEWCPGNIATLSGYQKDTALVYDQWQTIAYVYKKGSLSIYHNCNREWQLDGVYPVISDICSNEPMQITLGAVPQSVFSFGYRNFKGKIDELRIYTRALDSSEIVAFAGKLCTEPIKPVISFKQDSCFPQQLSIFDNTPADTSFTVLSRLWEISTGDTNTSKAFNYHFPAAGSYRIRLKLFTNQGILQRDTRSRL